MLISVFQAATNEYGYRKAIIREEDREYFEGLGFSSTQPEANINSEPSIDISVKPVTAFVESGDKGCGLPDSPEWHKAHIKAIEASDASEKTKKADVIEYVKEATGKKLDKRSRLDRLIMKAFSTVERNNDRDSK